MRQRDSTALLFRTTRHFLQHSKVQDYLQFVLAIGIMCCSMHLPRILGFPAILIPTIILCPDAFQTDRSGAAQ